MYDDWMEKIPIFGEIKNIKCNQETEILINYCPMCGRKLTK